MKISLARLIILLIILTFNLSCQKTDQHRQNLYKKEITVKNLQRRYAIYIPKNPPTSPMALVFELHGGGVYIEDLTGESGHKSPYKLWMDLADKEKFIVVYPQGLDGTYSKPSWNDCRKNAQINSNADDVFFISKLIEEISSTYKIDQDRIFISGTSNGGLMALRVAIELPEKISAVAVTAAAMPDKSKCKDPQKPLSVMFINATSDNYLPYDGSFLSNPPNPKHGSVYSVKKSVQIWQKLNQTNPKPDIYNFADIDPNDGSVVTRYIYTNPNNKTSVVLYKITGGGHLAPSIKERYSAFYEKYMGKQNHDIEMTTEVWNFFSVNYTHLY